MLFNSKWDEELTAKPKREYQLIELFAGVRRISSGNGKGRILFCFFERI